MKPPFEMSKEYRWTRFGPLNDLANQQGWILTYTEKLPSIKDCDCGCNNSDKYGASAFRDGASQIEVDHRKKKFAEFMKKHGIDVKF